MTSEILPITRSSNDWISAKDLRALLKQSLGLNVLKATVSGGSSTQYLTVTVRDASVDIAKLEAFIARLHTWTMDQSDYCSGQSIHVKTTAEVDAVHAAPFVEEIKAIVPTLEIGRGKSLSNGCVIWREQNLRDIYISNTETQKRGTYVWASDALQGAEWAIQKLALDMSRLGEGKGIAA